VSELRKRYEAFDLLMAQTGAIWLHDGMDVELAEKNLRERTVGNQFTVLVHGPHEKPDNKLFTFSIAHRSSIEDAEIRVTHEDAVIGDPGLNFRGMHFVSLSTIKDTFFSEPAVCLENPQRAADLVVIESLHRKLQEQLSKTRLTFELFPDRRTIVLDKNTTAKTLAEACSGRSTDTFHLTGTIPSPEQNEFGGDTSVEEFKSALWDKWDTEEQNVPHVFRFSAPFAPVEEEAVPLYFFRSKIENAVVMANQGSLFILGSSCKHTYDRETLQTLQKKTKRACPACHLKE